MQAAPNPSGLCPIDVTVSTRAYLESMWRRRDFDVALPAESIRTKHQNTFLGNVWHLANPMLTIGVYLLVFGGLLSVDRGIDDYLLWLTVGVFAYQLTGGLALPLIVAAHSSRPGSPTRSGTCGRSSRSCSGCCSSCRV